MQAGAAGPRRGQTWGGHLHAGLRSVAGVFPRSVVQTVEAGANTEFRWLGISPAALNQLR